MCAEGWLCDTECLLLLSKGSNSTQHKAKEFPSMVATIPLLFNGLSDQGN